MEFHIFHKFFFFFFPCKIFFKNTYFESHCQRGPMGYFLSLSLSLLSAVYIYMDSLLHVFIEMGSLPLLLQ